MSVVFITSNFSTPSLLSPLPLLAYDQQRAASAPQWESRASGDPNRQWFLDNQHLFTLINSGIKVLIGILGALLNLYVMISVLAVKEVRSVKQFPLFLISLVQIISGCVGNFLCTVPELSLLQHQQNSTADSSLDVLDEDADSSSFYFQGNIASSVRKWVLQDLANSDVCWVYILRQMVNRYFSGVLMVAIATEHFLATFYPSRLRRNPLADFAQRLTVYSALVLVVTSLIASCVVIGWKSDESYLCSHSFFSSETVQNVMEAIVLLIVPAFVSLVLYLSILARLLKVNKSTDHMGVTPRFTLASMTSCILWVLLWIPKVTFTLYLNFLHDHNQQQQPAGGEEVGSGGQRSKLFYVWLHLHLSDSILLLFSVSSPLVLILLLKELRVPIGWLRRKCCCSERDKFELWGGECTNEEYLEEVRRMSVDIQLRLQTRQLQAAFD